MDKYTEKILIKIARKRGLIGDIRVDRGRTIHGNDLGEWWASSDKSLLVFTIKDKDFKKYQRESKIKSILGNKFRINR